MKLSTAALLFLILAAALGHPAQGSPAHASLDHELRTAIRERHPSIIGNGGLHHPNDCCASYTPRNIRCVFMEDYYETSSVCSRPAVIFRTKKGQEVCADPQSERVQDCMMKLDAA